MRHTTSAHYVSAATPAWQVWSGLSGFKPNLNVPLLAEMIANATTVSSQKRKVITYEEEVSSKRMRISTGSVKTPNDIYPTAQALCSNRVQANTTIPILRHVLDIHYEDADIALNLSSESQINLGEIVLGAYRGRFVGLSTEHSRWLFLIPSLGIDADTNDYEENAANDLIVSCRTLQGSGYANIRASLRVTLPAVSLQLELVVSTDFPALINFQVPKHTPKKAVIALEDARRRLLRAAYVAEDVVSNEVKEPVTVSAFYNILQAARPLLSAAAERAIQCEGLLPSLLPFQRASVAWLLEREGMTLTSDGVLVSKPSANAFSFWQEVREGDDIWYMNRLSGELAEEIPESSDVHGGMLAEEPGLGKTVETIALILMNPAPPEWNPTLTRWDDNSCLYAQAVKSSLIVTPPSLISQWRDELAAHAPSLKVFVYDGWNKIKVPITASEASLQKLDEQKKSRTLSAAKNKGRKRNNRNDEQTNSEGDQSIRTHDDEGNPLVWCDYVHQYDVVITTYSVLRGEIWVARPPPDRPRREEVQYASAGRMRSPLVMVEWKRVVMDEVQMVGGGASAEMVSLIPRLSSLAVSGTPAKTQMADLIHVLKFLRIDSIVGGSRLWKRLLKPGFADDFAAFLRHYGIRTTKSSVANELTIPQQTRYLVPIELGRVERHVYDQTMENALLDLSLDARGVAATDNWQVDSVALRTHLRKLRGICTHPQVGNLQRRGDGNFKPNALKSMAAVLQVMKDQNWKNLMEDWKAKIQLLIRHAQLQQKGDTVEDRNDVALKVLQSAEQETQKFIKDIQTAIAKHDEKGEELRTKAAELRKERLEEVDVNGKGKQKESQGSDDDDEDSGDDGDSDDVAEKGLPKTPAGEEHKTKRGGLKSRLREGHLLMHRVHFLMGDVYHVLGNTSMEEASYAMAEQLRRQLLKSSEEEAGKAVALLLGNDPKQTLTMDSLLGDVPLLEKGGIRSSDLIEELNDMVAGVLNGQSKLLWKWRSHMISLLSRPLNSSGDSEADGQEYQRTLDEQGEVEAYMQCYVALLADRREALVNERTLLAAHDVREKHQRHTKAAMKAAAAAIDDKLQKPEDVDIQPEHEAMHSTLSTERKELLLQLKGRAVKSVLVDLHDIYLKITADKDPEKILVKAAMNKIRNFTSEQTAVHDKLEADLVLLRKSFNQRILYFRHLQEISDSVADVEWEEATVMAAIGVCATERANLDAKINTGRARFRYIDGLSESGDKGGPEEDTECVLCRCEFNRGYITHCGHVFCEVCMKLWVNRKSGKTCPVCRVSINVDTMQRFVLKTDQPGIRIPSRIIAGEPVPQSSRQISYNIIDPLLFEDIESMETYGDFGSKIQTLVRHLSHIKVTDPGAKSIVFSAWEDSLHIVEYALKENKIPCVRVDRGAKTIHQFRTEPDILVLLLHGERENAGLNVTCASRVFLLESVVHHSFEIQAIARIDRLGQTRPTEVFCYYAEDTVERNILDLAARKGLSLYTKDNFKGTVSISPFAKETEEAVDNIEERKKRKEKGDFIYKVDDMLAILFPHMYEDTEFLLPPDAFALTAQNDVDITMLDAEGTTSRITDSHSSEKRVTAMAGPSRLP